MDHQKMLSIRIIIESIAVLMLISILISLKLLKTEMKDPNTCCFEETFFSRMNLFNLDQLSLVVSFLPPLMFPFFDIYRG